MYGLDSLIPRSTGNLPKAILCVRGDFDPEQTAATTEGPQLPGSAASYGIGYGEQAAAKAKELMQRAKGSLFSGVEAVGVATKSSPYIELEVQYNPSSITLDTQAGRQVQGSADNPNQINITKQPTATTMSFQLVFDDMNIADAFMINQGLTLGNALQTGSSAVRKVMGQEYSLKQKMDGIMALLMHGATRQVIFFWAQMCFRGELTSVNSRYTMFNKEGNPIRGTIDLMIRQGGEAKDAELQYDESYWKDKFDKVFGYGGLDMDFYDQSLNSAFGNVLNVWM